MSSIDDFGLMWGRIRALIGAFFEQASAYYTAIVDNKLILAFVIMGAIFIGCALLKKMINT